MGQQRPRDPPDLLPPPAEGRQPRRAAVSRSTRAGRRPREWADVWLGLDVGSRHRPGQRHGPRDHRGRASSTSEFIDNATTGFEAYRANVEPYTLDYAERETGVPAAAIREAAHAYATADRAMICWTLGHHRAPQRRRQRAGADQPRAADRPRRALRLRAQPAARPEQRPGRRRHGRAARPAARLPARRERRAAGQVRRRLGRAGPAEARLAPVRDVRRDGARRAPGALRDRREPGAVRGRPDIGRGTC